MSEPNTDEAIALAKQIVAHAHTGEWAESQRILARAVLALSAPGAQFRAGMEEAARMADSQSASMLARARGSLGGMFADQSGSDIRQLARAIRAAVAALPADRDEPDASLNDRVAGAQFKAGAEWIIERARIFEGMTPLVRHLKEILRELPALPAAPDPTPPATTMPALHTATEVKAMTDRSARDIVEVPQARGGGMSAADTPLFDRESYVARCADAAQASRAYIDVALGYIATLSIGSLDFNIAQAAEALRTAADRLEHFGRGEAAT